MSLNAQQKKILDYIRQGRNSLADFTDNLSIPAPKVNLIAEDLEQKGYIVRKSLTGLERFNWLLTDKGVEELDPLPEAEMILLNEAGVNMNQFKILTYAKEHPDALAGEICANMKLNGNEMISDLCFLVDHKFLTEGGMIRRKVSLTDKGAEVLKKLSSKVKIAV